MESIALRCKSVHCIALLLSVIVWSASSERNDAFIGYAEQTGIDTYITLLSQYGKVIKRAS